MVEKFRQAIVAVARRAPEPDPKDTTTVALMNAGSLGIHLDAPKPQISSKAKPVPAGFKEAPKPEPDSAKEAPERHGGLMPKLPLMPGSFHDSEPAPEKKDEAPCSSKWLYPHLHRHIPDNQEP